MTDNDHDSVGSAYELALLQIATDQQRLFVQEYMVDLCGTRAAIRAGYSEATAAQQASRLLRNVKIHTAIKAGLDDIAERAHVSRGWVVTRLKDIAQKAFEAGDTQAANRSMQILAKSIGMLDEKLNVNVNHQGTAKVVMYFPDNKRGPEGTGDDGSDKGSKE